MWWVIGAIGNGVVAVAYFLIVAAILRPLVRSRQLRTNRLGTATAAIFFSCGVHHGMHTVHMLLPALGLAQAQGLATRAAFDWPMATWDLVTAVIGVYYWTLRRSYGSLMHGAQLFEDMRQRERQALELNDTVLQGMVVAKLALELQDPVRARQALDMSITNASAMISDLLGPAAAEDQLKRTRPALLRSDA